MTHFWGFMSLYCSVISVFDITLLLEIHAQTQSQWLTAFLLQWRFLLLQPRTLRRRSFHNTVLPSAYRTAVSSNPYAQRNIGCNVSFHWTLWLFEWVSNAWNHAILFSAIVDFQFSWQSSAFVDSSLSLWMKVWQWKPALFLSLNTWTPQPTLWIGSVRGFSPFSGVIETSFLCRSTSAHSSCTASPFLAAVSLRTGRNGKSCSSGVSWCTQLLVRGKPSSWKSAQQISRKSKRRCKEKSAKFA